MRNFFTEDSTDTQQPIERDEESQTYFDMLNGLIAMSRSGSSYKEMINYGESMLAKVGQ
jgi:hypothetical protein